MSRTSRKNLTQMVTTEKIHRAAGYVRLSVVKAGQPQDSIENQKRMVEDFISGRRDVVLNRFFIDENASGSSFERDAFQELLDAVDAGEIDCIIVEDLSRLGRNAIETTFYIQHLFPQKGVRFISISDRFDTLDGITDASSERAPGLRIPIANIFNEEYAADISRKTQASIDANIHAGKCVAPKAPYGYKKATDDCHQLVVDPDAAAVVKEIFSMTVNKVSMNEIVRRLNLANIPTPIEYAKSQGLEGDYNFGNGSWNTRSVKYILTNRTYTGDLRQGKDSHIIENTHEPLIDKVVFEQIQKLFSVAQYNSQPQVKSSLPNNPLKGKVICASCGSKMQRRKGTGNAGWHFFSCITNNRKGSGCSTGMYIREPDIRNTIKSVFAKEGTPTATKSEMDAFIADKVSEVVVSKEKPVEIHLYAEGEVVDV